MSRRPKIELLHVPDCPNVEAARHLLRECLAESGLGVRFEDKEGDYPSPTILINGQDVMGAVDASVASCRIDVPTRERLLAALAND